MNPNFTRYQKLPNPDTLLVSANLTEIGGRTESRTNIEALRSLFPLPEGEGQGEGKHTAASMLVQQNKSFRA